MDESENFNDNPDDEIDLDGDYEPRFIGYHDLMRFKISEILLVSSFYDAFTIEEDGGLSEQLFSEYRDLDITSPPRVIRVSSAKDAFKELEERDYDLVITMTHLIDLDPIEFGREVKKLQQNIPVVLLVIDLADLENYKDYHELEGIDNVFYWSGDSSLFMAIVKYFEDTVNIISDTRKADVRVILVIEDSARFYSMFMPRIYTEVMNQTQELVSQGLNEHEKLLRRRARPKILLARTYEEAMKIYEDYKKYMLAIITDVSFPRNGKLEKEAGLQFIENVNPDIAVLMQSSQSRWKDIAEKKDIPFLDKNSDLLLHQLRQFLKNELGFGKFIFRNPDGKKIGIASDMKEFIDELKRIPIESVLYHAKNNHYSRWFYARGEFALASQIQPQKVSDFNTDEEVREYLVNVFRDASRKKQLGVITDFDQQKYEFEDTITRFGSGSLGGKGRGLAFLAALFIRSGIQKEFPNNRIRIPETLIIATEEFDKFIINNDLHDFAESDVKNEEIISRFLMAELSSELKEGLRRYLQHAKTPLAVRSSSLLEDSHNQPFAGIYSTYMLPNNHNDPEVKLEQLCQAVKLVYASAFFQSAKSYIQATLHKAEEEKMAIVIQRIVGNKYDERFYPIISGVAQSKNFYPLPPLERDEPIVSLALGLGKIVVEGGNVLSFSPSHPNVIPGFSSTEEILKNSQKKFHSLDLIKQDLSLSSGEESTLQYLDITKAESDGTLDYIASVYDPNDDRIRDSIDREGLKVIMFAQILKYNEYPISKVLDRLINIGKRGMGCPIEIEFALAFNEKKEMEIFILQIRPLLSAKQHVHVDIEQDISKENILVYSSKAMGNGIRDFIKDIVMVKTSTFDRTKTMEIAVEIGEINKKLNRTPYILIGPGRWGSNDRFLGIPVNWNQISGVKTMVEIPIEGITIEPSHGSHFFHNVTSLGIPYLTVTQKSKIDFFDESWLENLTVSEEKQYIFHIKMDTPLIVEVDGRCGIGIIKKNKKKTK
jgi:CheY-like chemotaxis protein